MRVPEEACDGDGNLLAGRYMLGAKLGEGGVAVVHRAIDLVSGREVALKQLRVNTHTDGERARELFRREFHMLSQLAHPGVVSVFDYGVDGTEPYYTMELLDGGDLLDGVPYEWRTACRFARDVCSALSLIHSRRMVFRDLSPKNVRCTSNGRAKLLDFGALAPMGPARLFVGTPATAAPEAVHLQPLDARTDLYSLGATLYYALTGRRAYPAARLTDLDVLWQTPPPPPSAFMPEVPRALDGLVLELLQLDRMHRPASAAETLDRLTAIAELERDESVQLVSNAYLSTPVLVGRDAALQRFVRRMKAALEGAGGAVLVHGPRGVGRTRFLDACVLEAKVAGVVVLRADAADATGTEYAVARTLAMQLLDAAPDVARARAEPKRAVLGRLVPALAEAGDAAETSSPDAGELQRALREWFIAVAAERPLFVAVDDVDGVDPPSAALVALLARDSPQRRLLVASSIPSDGAFERTHALALLAQESQAIALAPLSGARIERLLRSLFGDVPNVQLVAHRLHALSGGLPRDLMQLAQHLVDRGLARYRSGAWSLPQELDGDALPSDMAQARRAKIEGLGADARELAQAFALGPSDRYTFGECVLVSRSGDPAEVVRSLDELTQAELVTLVDSDYSLSGAAWREPLRSMLSEESTGRLSAKLAELCGRRPDGGFLQARYLLAAGEEDRGLDVLVEFAKGSTERTAISIEAFSRMVQGLPSDWLETYDRALALCEKLGRARNDAYQLLLRISGIASQLPFDATRYLVPLLEQLEHDAGLSIYADLPRSLPPAERLRKSLETASQRFAETEGRESVVPPEVAVMKLGQTVASAIGNLAGALSVDLIGRVPSLAPLASLSPAFKAWQTLAEGVFARMLGKTDRARGIYERQLELLAAPDRAGLEETYQATQMFGITLTLGMLEAAMGLEKSLERAKVLEVSPLHEVNAVRIRMMYALWQGDVTTADRYRSEAELLAVERARRQTNEGAHLPKELLGHALMDDLTRVKRTLDAIEPLAARSAGWKMVSEWAHAEYQRIRGNPSEALARVEAALASMSDQGHSVWSEAAGARVRLLVLLDRCEEAVSAGRAYLEEATLREIDYEQSFIRMPLAVALARVGSRDEAERHADEVIATFCERGVTGITLGLAYETRARVALSVSDRDGFEKYRQVCREHYRAGRPGPLAARYERLLREARVTAGTHERVVAHASGEYVSVLDSASRVTARMDLARDSSERAQTALHLLLENSGAADGFLLRLRDGDLEICASVGEAALSETTLAEARAFLEERCGCDEPTQITDEYSSKQQWTVDGRTVYHPVLLSHEHEGALAVTGIALLRTERGSAYRNPVTTAAVLSRLSID